MCCLFPSPEVPAFPHLAARAVVSSFRERLLLPLGRHKLLSFLPPQRGVPGLAHGGEEPEGVLPAVDLGRGAGLDIFKLGTLL